MTVHAYFRDRVDAGRQLAARLSAYADREDVVVLALPRGGVPVAFEVATALRAPLDVLVVRKLGAPGHEEFAIGAIGPGGVRVMNDEALRWMRVTAEAIEAVAQRESRELERREVAYRAGRAAPELAGRTVLLVDDGLATGATMKAAVQVARASEPREVVVAVPVGAPDTCAELRAMADDAVCVRMPEPFHAVGLWYAHFDQTSDDEVRALLARAAGERSVE